jgi:hypothetical protein
VDILLKKWGNLVEDNRGKNRKILENKGNPGRG